VAECGPPCGTAIKPRGFDIDEGEGGKRRTPSIGTPVVLSGGTTDTIHHERPNGDVDDDVAAGAGAGAAPVAGSLIGAQVTACLPKAGAQLATWPLLLRPDWSTPLPSFTVLKFTTATPPGSAGVLHATTAPSPSSKALVLSPPVLCPEEGHSGSADSTSTLPSC